MGVCRGVSLPEETYKVFENSDGTFRLETKDEQTERLRKSKIQEKVLPKVEQKQA
jgi:ribosomal protein S4E